MAACRGVCRTGGDLLKQQAVRASKNVMGVPNRPASTTGTVIMQDKNNGSAGALHAGVKPFSQVPGPKGLPLVGSLFEVLLQKDKGGNDTDMIMSRFAEYGPIFKENLGALKMVHVKDPGAVSTLLRLEGKHPRRIQMEPWRSWRDENNLPRGILIQDGADWKRMRSQLDRRMMRPNYVTTYLPAFNDVITDFVAHLRKQRDKKGAGVTIPDLDQELFKWSLEAIGTVLYETRLGALLDNPDPEIGRFIDAVNRMFATTEGVMYYPRSLRKMLIPKKHKEHEETWATIFRVGARLIDAKVSQLDAALERGEEAEGFLSDLLARGTMTRAEVYANVNELMLAAVDTTSNTMQWVLYELSRRPEIQDRLRQEIDHVTMGQAPTHQNLQDMPYLRGVMKEILRIYPVASSVTRVINEDLVLLGYHLPKNTTVIGNTFAMGRDPDLFDDPLEVKPERWYRDESNKHTHSFAYLPFSFGPRGCIGKRVAELEMQLLLARIIQTFCMEPLTDQPAKIHLRPLLVPKKAVEIKFTDRQ